MTQLKSRFLMVTLTSFLAAVGLVEVLPMVKTNAREQDMAGIKRLHERDIAATLSGDPKELADLWTDDAVRLARGGQAEIGKRLIRAKDEREKAEHPGRKILSYVPEIKETEIADGWAFEWGYFSGSYKDSPDGQVKSFRGKLLRVLRKQGDGSWKFARVMWNLAE
jgi:ketosteroid isomerase-like protein